MKAKDKNAASSFAWPKDFFLLGGALVILILFCGNLYALFSTGIYNASMALEVAVIFLLVVNTSYLRKKIFFLKRKNFWLLDDANETRRTSTVAKWIFVIGALCVVSGIVSSVLFLFNANLAEFGYVSNIFLCAGVFLILVPGMLFFCKVIRSLTKR